MRAGWGQPGWGQGFFWATLLNGLGEALPAERKRARRVAAPAGDAAAREAHIDRVDRQLGENTLFLIVYDALDIWQASWPRRRLLTQALFEVVWATRAFRNIRLEALPPAGSIEDDELRFIELPKLRSGAVRLLWSDTVSLRDVLRSGSRRRRAR